jgi:hypothetical protein
VAQSSTTASPSEFRSGSLKRNDKDIIDLREDNSDEEVRAALIKASPFPDKLLSIDALEQKSRFLDSEDSEDDYANIHAGLEINDSQNVCGICGFVQSNV